MRLVNVFYLIALFVVVCLVSIGANIFDFHNLVKVFLFVLINIIVLIIYYSFKYKTFVNPINNFLGVGDILFFIAVMPLFNLLNYMLYFITGLIFSLVFYFVYRLFFKKNGTIPLAGFLSLYLIIILLFNWELNQYNFLWKQILI